MKMNGLSKSLKLGFAALTLAVVTTGVSLAEQMPQFPQPAPEHAWLQQFVGNWEYESQAYMAPDKPPMLSKGTETVRPVGGFWIMDEITGTMFDKPFTGLMTLGYDTNKQKYVGSWVDSMTGQSWDYEGTVDPTGKILTLESEGMCPMRPGKITKFKEVMTLKDANHKVFTSSMLGEDGNWVTTMTSEARRK